jgi:hypothetical protein
MVLTARRDLAEAITLRMRMALPVHPCSPKDADAEGSRPRSIVVLVAGTVQTKAALRSIQHVQEIHEAHLPLLGRGATIDLHDNVSAIAAKLGEEFVVTPNLGDEIIPIGDTRELDFACSARNHHGSRNPRKRPLAS